MSLCYDIDDPIFFCSFFHKYAYILERKKLKHESEDSDGASVAKILKEDYLKSTGSLKSLVASRYTGADVNNIKVMRSKDHRSCITCFCLTTQFIYSGSKDGSIVKCKYLN